MTDQLTTARDRIAEAVERLVTGADLQAMLDVAARFHTYSSNNIWLIFAQRPDATRVVGYRTWCNLDRRVRQGEHGIAVLAPIVTRTKPIDTNDERDHHELVQVLRGFKVVHVFDISQTDGADLADVAPTLLAGSAPIESTFVHPRRSELDDLYEAHTPAPVLLPATPALPR